MQKQHKLKVKGSKKERHMFVKLKQHKMIEECGFEPVLKCVFAH